MESLGMEAFLDFPDFGLESAPSERKDTSAFQERIPTAPYKDLDEIPAESKTTDSVVEIPAADESSSFGIPQKKKRKRLSDSPTRSGSPSKNKSKTDSESAKRREKQAGSGDDAPSTSEQRNDDEDADDDGPMSPSEQDFESDLLDLLPFKEEDPEDIAERQKLQLLISHLSEEQLNRYEVYRRASFPKASVRRIMQTVAASTVSQTAVIAMAGIAKMHVGEIVEQALDVKEEWGDTGPVEPKHIREALRRLRNHATTTPCKYRKKTHVQPYP